MTAAKRTGAPANQDSRDGVVAAQIVLVCSLMLTEWDVAKMYMRQEKIIYIYINKINSNQLIKVTSIQSMRVRGNRIRFSS